MAKIPLPERGQPLDLTYINSLADAVNTLYNQVSVSTSNYASIDTTSQDKINLKTSEIGLVAGRVEVYNNATVTVAQEKDFSYNFTNNFKYAPIVTATPVNVGNTPAGKNVSVILKNVTTSRVEGVVRFGSAGDSSLWVNLIIVGVPN
jgi:hypothetical protein